jgi:hypothetical protein
MLLISLRKALALVMLTAGIPSCFGNAINTTHESLRNLRATRSQGVPANKTRERKQTRFGAEQPVQRVASIPAGVLKLLQADERNRTCLPTMPPQKEIPASWFVASLIKLSIGQDSELLVTSNNSCLNGANVVPFWIFRKQGARYDLILKATGLVLDLLDTRTNHYRDIRLTSLSANREYISLYKFNGNSYVKSSSVAKRPRSKKKF